MSAQQDRIHAALSGGFEFRFTEPMTEHHAKATIDAWCEANCSGQWVRFMTLNDDVLRWARMCFELQSDWDKFRAAVKAGLGSNAPV